MKKPSLYHASLYAISLFLIVISVMLATNKKWQLKVKDFLYPEKRIVLASLQTSLNIKNHSYKVLKIKSHKKIWIEIYDLMKPNAHVVSFNVDAKADGQMLINSKTSPLFASDLDGDSVFEIVAPVYGLDFQPQIHAFKLNPLNGNFSKVPTEQLIKLL